MYFSIDWLKQHLAGIPERDKQVEEMAIFVTSAADFLGEECHKLAQEIYHEGKTTGNKTFEAFGSLYTSLSWRFMGDPKKAEAAFHEAVRLHEELQPSMLSSIVSQMIAFEYWNLGQREKAFETAYRGLALVESLPNEGKGWATFQLGVFHSDLKDYDVALDYFRNSEEMAIKFGLNYQLARVHSGIGAIHIARNELEEGIRRNELALEGYRSSGHQTAISRSLNDLGVIRKRQGDLVQAEAYLREALDIRTKMNYAPGISTSRMELGSVLLAQGRLNEGEKILLDALAICTAIRSKQKISQCHLLLSELYKKKQDPWKALAHIENYFSIRSEVAGEEASNRIQHLQQKHVTEKTQHEAEIHRLKNVELRKAYDQIEEKNKNILDSINYAQRIQYALLAPGDFLKTNLPEHFILFRPKDIVSGDFYWAAKVSSSEFRVSSSELTNPKSETRNPEQFFIAVCDSTGHGVPGAFMSLLNSSFLNEAINEKGIREPNRVLDYVRDRLVHSISEGEQKDGMDCTLLRFDAGSSTITYAAAHNSPVLVRNGKVTDLEADKMPVGRSEKSRPFSAFSVNVQPGDMLYLLTDGYSDQFGGPRGKKFKYKNLLELLETISALPPAEQKEALERRFEEWKGDLEQLDDILLLGIRM